MAGKELCFLFSLTVVLLSMHFRPSGAEQLRIEEFFIAGSKLHLVPANATEEDIVKILGVENDLTSYTVGGIGFGGVRTIYFSELKNHTLTMTSCLDSDSITVEWQAPGFVKIKFSTLDKTKLPVEQSKGDAR